MGGAGFILRGARNKTQSLSEARQVLTMEPHPHLLNFILRQDLAKLHSVALNSQSFFLGLWSG